MDHRPTLDGARVRLRPPDITDLDAYLTVLQDAESLRLTGTQRTFTREDAAGWLAALPEREGRIDLAIIRRDTGSLIGEVVLNDIDTTNRSAGLRIGLRTADADQGFGREALRLMLGYAFDTLGLHRVELSVYAFNPRALHVYTSLGFREEGRRRDVLYQDGIYHDIIDMAMLEDEYRASVQARPPT